MGNLHAQNQNGGGNVAGLQGYWEVLLDGGRFVTRVNEITSVSQHEYLIDGAVKVYECTLDTRGNVIVRFYFIEPVTASSSVSTGTATINRLKDIANKVTTKTGVGDLDTIVTKHYPTTTHAKTTEYRLKNKETVARIYDHLYRVWAKEKGRGKANRLIITGG